MSAEHDVPRRPRGRAPKGMTWDLRSGGWVPKDLAAAPSAAVVAKSLDLSETKLNDAKKLTSKKRPRGASAPPVAPSNETKLNEAKAYITELSDGSCSMDGWQAAVQQRKSGVSAGSFDCYFIAPLGFVPVGERARASKTKKQTRRRFRSRKDIARALGLVVVDRATMQTTVAPPRACLHLDGSCKVCERRAKTLLTTPPPLSPLSQAKQTLRSQKRSNALELRSIEAKLQRLDSRGSFCPTRSLQRDRVVVAPVVASPTPRLPGLRSHISQLLYKGEANRFGPRSSSKAAEERSAMEVCTACPKDGEARRCNTMSCVNVATSTECHPDCLCENQKFRKGVASPGLEVFPAGAKGNGVRTTKALGDGAWIAAMTGEVITGATLRKRHANVKDTYAVSLDRAKDLYIDARNYGNIGRYINHSCAPSARLIKWSVDGFPVIGIVATRAIAAGEELTFDYQLDLEGSAATRCLCGEASCRGLLLERAEAEREEEYLREVERGFEGYESV